MKRKFTREEVVFILELRSQGIKYDYIAHYVYGISKHAMRGRLKRWGAL